MYNDKTYLYKFMQAVLPIAGKGTRMAVKHSGPKHLLSVAGRPLIEYTIDILPKEIDELILIVGGPHEKAVREYFGSKYRGRKISYIRQDEQKGLGHAVQLAGKLVRGRFLVFVPDDLYAKESFQKMIDHNGLSALAQRHREPQYFGVLIPDNDGFLVRAVEKPKEFVSNLVSPGAFVLDQDFFNVKVPPSARGEIELPDIINALVSKLGKKIKVIETDKWIPVNSPEQLEAADKAVRDRRIL